MNPAWLPALPCLVLVACRPDGSPYARRGPHAVGTLELAIAGDSRFPARPATLWYPAMNPGHAREETIYQGATEGIGPSGQAGPLKGRALAGAAMDASAGAPPLVVFSPERRKGRMLYAALLEHWASFGFAVLAFNAGPGPAEDAVLIHRILAFSDALDAGGAIRGGIDRERVALAGHGQGATTALFAASAQGSAGADPRVKGVLALAPEDGGRKLAGLPPATVSVLLMDGSRSRARQLYEGLVSVRKAEATLVDGGGDLYGFSRDEVAACVDVAPLDTGPWDIRRARGVIHALTAAFLLDALEGDPEARKALRAESVSSKEVQYATTWK